MKRENKTSDVFISYAANDSALAEEIATYCRNAGLGPFTALDSLPPGADWTDVVWESLAESRVLLLIISPAGLTPRMTMEIGAASAWNKPILAIVTDPAVARLPFVAPDVRYYTLGNIQDVIEAIQANAHQLSDGDRDILARLYGEAGVPADQLATDPAALLKIVRGFKRATGKSATGERLLSEILRLRKQGKLKRTTRSPRSRAASPKSGTA